MKFCLLVSTAYGVVVYDAGSDPDSAVKLLVEIEPKLAPRAVSLAILHPKTQLPKS